MTTCPRCGTGNSAGNFCANCGAPLQTPTYQQSAPQPPTYQQSPPLRPAFQQPGQQPPPNHQPASVDQLLTPMPVVSRRPAWQSQGLVGLAAIGLLVAGLVAYEQGLIALPGRGNAPASAAGQPASSTKAKPGWVVGTVTDANGAPLKLSSSQVVVQVTGDLNDGNVYKGNQQVDKKGRFEAEVPPGSYTASGFVKVNFEGTEFWLALDPVGGKALQDSKPGVVKDLQWKLTGLRPESDRANPYSYYGSFVFMLYQGRTLPDDAQVTFTVTPLTPLVDGSQGKPLVFQATGQELKKGKNLVDIPLAKYRITGEVTLKDGTKKKALISGATGPATLSQEFTFKPNSMGEGMEGVSLWMMGES